MSGSVEGLTVETAARQGICQILELICSRCFTSMTGDSIVT